MFAFHWGKIEVFDSKTLMPVFSLFYSQDVRPGLLSLKSSREKQQEHKHQEKNTKNVTKPRNVLEKEKREEGLGSALSSQNKGFALLQKMGYKPGMAIGKKGTVKMKTYLHVS